MTTQVRQIAFRLKSDGKAEVQRDFADIKTTGEAAYDAVAAATERATAAAERAEKRNLALAQSGREAHAAWVQQQKFNAVLGVDRAPSAGARESAAIFEAEAEAADRAAAKAALLRAQIDPLGAAQNRLNMELAEYAALAKRGDISTDELAAGQALARKRFDETTLAISRQAGGLSRLERASRLNLVRQGADVAVTGAMGMNPAMIAIQQGPQILDALATSGIRASAALIGVSAAALLVGGGLIAASVAAEGYGRSLNAVEAAADGLGRAAKMSSADVAAMAEEAGKTGEISTKSAREQAVAYLRTGVIGAEVLDRLIARGRDYQTTFGEDAAASTKRLADAMADPAKAAATWGVQIGAVDSATLTLIESMVRQNDLIGAQMVLLDALGPRLLSHKDYTTDIESAWDAVARAISNATDKLGKFLYTTDEEAIQKVEQRQSLAKQFPWLFNQDRMAAEAGELDKLRADQAARQKRLADNAAATARATAQASERSAYDRAFPEDARIRALQDDRARFVRDSTARDKTPEDQARARDAIAKTDRQIAELEKKKDGATRSSGRHAAALARETESLEANAAGALSAAEAYLRGSAEGLKADAARTAATRAARSGADAELRTRQQLALNLAEQASAGAKAAAEMEGETASRKRLNDAVAAGTMTAEEANRELALEGQLRPLTIALTLAEGEARTTLQKVIDALKTSYADLNKERARESILADTAGNQRSIALLETELRLVRATEEERAVGIARRQAELELEAKTIPATSAEGRDYIASAEAEARTRSRLSRRDYAAQTVMDQNDSITLAEREIALLRSKPTLRDEELDRLRVILDLKRRGITSEMEEYKEILRKHDALREVEQQLERSRAVWGVIEDTGSRALDRFGDLVAKGEDDWDAWKSAGLDAIQEIIAEMTKLWLVNPLKNFLFGQNNPTGGDAGGVLGNWIGSIFGGGSGGGSGGGRNPFVHGSPIIPGFARGTESAPGGLALYGEDGPEIGFVPAGTRIKSHASSIDMLRAALRGDGGGEGALQVHLGGFTIDARGADPAAAARVERAVADLRRDIPAIAESAIRDAVARRRLRLGAA